MSDEEFYSEESYEFEFEEEDDEAVDEDEVSKNEEETEGTSLETIYYTAKGLKYDDINASIKSLCSLTQSPTTSPDDINWIFKAYKQLVKISFNDGRYQEALSFLKELIAIIPKVGGTYAEDSLTKIVHNYTTSGNSQFVSQLYDIILSFLNSSVGQTPTYDRLWLRIGVNQLKSHLENGEFPQCKDLLDQVHSKLETVSELSKKAYLLDITASEIEYLFSINPLNLPLLNKLYKQSLKITTAVTHPRQIGVIQECGAKIQFYRGNYEKARLEFYDSFNSYDEAGSSLKKKILKYLTLCSLLTENQFNPFESQETSTYSGLPEYRQLLLLIKAYDDSNLAGLTAVMDLIAESGDPLAKDDIFKHASQQIIINLRAKSIKNYLRAYSSIKFEFIRGKLNLTQAELEQLIKKLVIAGRLTNIKLDYVNEVVISEPKVHSSLPLTLNAKDIYYNMKISASLNVQQCINYKNSDSMEIDQPRTSPSSTSRFLFTLDRAANEIELLKSVDTWFSYVNSCFPPAEKHELSQVDQIAFEQRAELNDLGNFNVRYDKINEESEQNTQAGILSSTIEDIDVEDVSGPQESIKKSDILSNWLKELTWYHNDLI